jgi:hypothetical protein
MSAINRLQSGYHPNRLRDGTQSRTGMIGGAAWQMHHKSWLRLYGQSVMTEYCTNTPHGAVSRTASS